ncbi:hypothetical protein CR513_49981, partial [Mucuna pruriens]
MVQILKEVYHMHLLDVPQLTDKQIDPNRKEWCEFHRTHGHETEDYWTLKSQIDNLIQEGHLRKTRSQKAGGHALLEYLPMNGVAYGKVGKVS